MSGFCPCKVGQNRTLSHYIVIIVKASTMPKCLSDGLIFINISTLIITTFIIISFSVIKVICVIILVI